jgi:hypothetical protein
MPLACARVHDALGDLDVLFERIMRCVDHDGAEEPGINAIVARRFIAVIEVHRENRLREDFAGGTDHGLKHTLVSVASCTLGNLDDERGLGLDGSFEQAHGLLGVVDVGTDGVGAESVLAVGVFEQLRSGDDHIRREQSGRTGDDFIVDQSAAAPAAGDGDDIARGRG